MNDIRKLIEEISEKTGCTYKLLEEEGEVEFNLIFNLDGGRKQEITVSPFEEKDMTILRLITYIGKQSEFSEQQFKSFLNINISLRYGAFALFQGYVVLTETFNLSQIVNIDILIERISYLIRMADNFEKTLIGLDRS